MHPVIDPTEVDRPFLIREGKMNTEQLVHCEKSFSGLFTGVALMTLLSEPALANKTYSRAKTC